MKIAIAGTRGIPARYGGFETFAEELSARLVERGHEVWVYCRVGSRESGVGGRSTSESTNAPTPETRNPTPVHRIVLPAIRHKYFETVTHTLLSSLDALRRDFDVVLLCNAANAFVLPLLRAARIPVAINVDGIERHRRKWNAAGRLVYAIGESFSALFANKVVADANVIAEYYRSRYGIEPVTIPYGAEFPSEEDSDVLDRLGVEAGNYILYVSRFEPENNPLEVVEAYERVAGVGSRESGVGGEPGTALLRHPRPDTRLPPLVMLGAAAYARDLDTALKRHASDRILFPGALYGPDYRTLQRNALLYIQATEVGGTHPAMIEAMASGGCVLAHDTPENREVGGDAAGYFRLRPSETLSGTLREFLASPVLREQMRIAARRRAGERYSWSAVTDAYERLFAEIVGH
ncbi:MAG: glycosyltransferase [Acidobacteria bacterium]|nr:glycosyltransferase [Acidobacteriota bacterium]MBV9071289.1 glycosyltransferase [Acidobacteriota bacterium]MBV9187563.1 glycosyltransferase [Acidobacteriota bacterium]